MCSYFTSLLELVSGLFAFSWPVDTGDVPAMLSHWRVVVPNFNLRNQYKTAGCMNKNLIFGHDVALEAAMYTDMSVCLSVADN